jgi:hypothetical protein
MREVARTFLRVSQPLGGSQMHGSIAKPATAGDDVVAKKKTRRRKRQTSKKQKYREAARNISHVPDRVRTVTEWCVINGFSEDTGRRILAGGKGPKVLQLSPNRIGIRDSDNKAWQDTLVRGGE